ncbi:MAG: hypothetical protein CPSOU_4073 [uncultured Paraburkholderia sp.]|nr:MAG: hypothetical protein CPSOU_4073 [uncultured Paraburkholderia sp.]
MFNTDSLALQPTAEWRTCSNPVRDQRPAHERQPFKRQHLSCAKRGAEHLVARVSESGFDDPAYLTQLRRDLVRFARLQLRDVAPQRKTRCRKHSPLPGHRRPVCRTVRA